MTDVVVVGAGPAGMSAALEMLRHGLSVTVLDDQPAPGGRIFAAIESREPHGAEDRRGLALVQRFRDMGGEYRPRTEMWQIERGPRVFITEDGRAQLLEPRYVVLATGAQERPMPFPGWQLPGVMTIGAAQLLLKTARQIPSSPVWLAGSGPLLLLYATQLLDAGGEIAGILDTGRPRRYASLVLDLVRAVRHGWRDILRGCKWLFRLRRIRSIRCVVEIEAIGASGVEAIRYRTSTGDRGHVPAEMLLIHNGVVPGIHASLAAACDHVWNPTQSCYEPVRTIYGETSRPDVYVAGDGAGIAGAAAAMLSGKLVGLAIARAANMVDQATFARGARPLQVALRRTRHSRRFIDNLYPSESLDIPDHTLVCRCEEVTAQTLRAACSNRPQLGADGLKIATRAGMGPCQGRQCGLSLTRLVSESSPQAASDIGLLRIRPPIKPLSLSELAALETLQ